MKREFVAIVGRSDINALMRSAQLLDDNRQLGQPYVVTVENDLSDAETIRALRASLEPTYTVTWICSVAEPWNEWRAEGITSYSNGRQFAILPPKKEKP